MLCFFEKTAFLGFFPRFRAANKLGSRQFRLVQTQLLGHHLVMVEVQWIIGFLVKKPQTLQRQSADFEMPK